MNRRIVFVLLAGMFASVGGKQFSARASEPRAPRLAIVISVDQLRSDYLLRFADLFAPASTNGKVLGGFKFLQEKGTSFVDARHSHYPLFTGPGHAVQLTGAHPYKSGIVGNYWFDAKEKGARRYCVEDLSELGEIIGTHGPMKKDTRISPVTLQVSTVGDELKIATGSGAKVWGLALKDRASVLMAGHFANGALWYDEESGDWVSSRYYCTNGELPGWVAELNRATDSNGKRLVDSFTNRVWEPTHKNLKNRIWTGPTDFRHEMTNKVYKDLTFTPYGNDFVLETARVLIEKEDLGSDEIPDILALNFSSNDYVGHEYGADSAETLDITLRTDLQLGAFFAWIDSKIGLTNTLIVLTSDHGAAPYPRQIKAETHLDAGIGNERANESKLNQSLREWYGFRKGRTNAITIIEYNLYIDHSALQTDVPRAEVHRAVAKLLVDAREFGYYAAYTREQILAGEMPRTDIAERVMKGFSPENSGDIVIVPRSFWVHLDPKYKYKTSHGSPYTYDTSVPLLMTGPGIQHAKVFRPVSTLDIAPTLSYLLRILAPSGAEGEILNEALDEH